MFLDPTTIHTLLPGLSACTILRFSYVFRCLTVRLRLVPPRLMKHLNRINLAINLDAWCLRFWKTTYLRIRQTSTQILRTSVAYIYFFFPCNLCALNASGLLERRKEACGDLLLVGYS